MKEGIQRKGGCKGGGMRDGEGRCEFRGEGDGFSGIPKWHQEGNEELGRGKETWNKEKGGIVSCKGA